MTDLMDRKGQVAIEEHPPILKRGTQVPPPDTGKPRRFLRWMGWMVALAAALAIVTYAIVTATSDTTTSPPAVLEDISRHENPEVFLEIMPSTEVAGVAVVGPGLVAPDLAMIDPHESPEIMWVYRDWSG